MTDVKQFEQRITSALERVALGLDKIRAGASQDQSDQIAALTESLDAERDANAQLEERVVALREKQDKVLARLEEEAAKLRAEADTLARENTRLANLMAAVRANNDALRTANAQGVGDPTAINDAMALELDALRADRESERAALDAVIAELQPIAEGGINA